MSATIKALCCWCRLVVTETAAHVVYAYLVGWGCSPEEARIAAAALRPLTARVFDLIPPAVAKARAAAQGAWARFWR